MTRTTLIIEDHPIFRDALAFFLRALLGESNVMAASSVEEVLTMAPATSAVGLVLLDLGLPGLKGAEAIQWARRQFPDAAILVVSGTEDRRDIDMALRSGACAFISKSVPSRTIAETVQKIFAGEILSERWITQNQGTAIAHGQAQTLTPRQKETLNYLCQGMSNKEIGLRLQLAEITVKTHVSAIFRILGVYNRTQAVVEARRIGLYVQDERLTA